jgi:excisionase family DNA binding protein
MGSHMSTPTAPPATFKLPAPWQSALSGASPERFAYRVPDACTALGISRTSLYELVKRGEITLIKIAGRTLVPRSELERLTRVDRAT